MNSKFVKHQPCPDCGSRDNCAVYDDGHEWCFGCGYYKGTVAWKKIKREVNHVDRIFLPSDSTPLIALKASEWYHRYRITDVEAQRYKFCWSESNKWLIFPVYSNLGELVFYQARTFGTGPKYFNRGSMKETDHIFGDKSRKTLFVVEDVLSAIKIGRIATVMPLMGSTLSDEKLLRLSRLYDTIVIWLDYDKSRASLALRVRAKNVFRKAFFVSLFQDPKCAEMEKLSYIVKSY